MKTLRGWAGLARISRAPPQEPHYRGCSRRFIRRIRLHPRDEQMTERKPFLLRTDPEVLDALHRWASDELRSVIIGHAGHGLEVLGCGRERLRDRRCIALIGSPHGHADDSSVSRSTACSALCARCGRPSFIFVMRASGSCGCCQPVLRPFCGRCDRVAPGPPVSASRCPTRNRLKTGGLRMVPEGGKVAPTASAPTGYLLHCP